MGGEQSGWLRLRLYYIQPNGIHWCHLNLHVLHKVAKSMAKLTSSAGTNVKDSNIRSLSIFPTNVLSYQTFVTVINIVKCN